MKAVESRRLIKIRQTHSKMTRPSCMYWEASQFALWEWSNLLYSKLCGLEAFVSKTEIHSTSKDFWKLTKNSLKHVNCECMWFSSKADFMSIKTKYKLVSNKLQFQKTFLLIMYKSSEKFMTNLSLIYSIDTGNNKSCSIPVCIFLTIKMPS